MVDAYKMHWVVHSRFLSVFPIISFPILDLSSLCRCPECREAYRGQYRRHRYAERTGQELVELKEEREGMAGSCREGRRVLVARRRGGSQGDRM